MSMTEDSTAPPVEEERAAPPVEEPLGPPSTGERLMSADRLLRRLLDHNDAGRSLAVAAGYGRPSPVRVEHTRGWAQRMRRVCLQMAAALDDGAAAYLGGPLDPPAGDAAAKTAAVLDAGRSALAAHAESCPDCGAPADTGGAAAAGVESARARLFDAVVDWLQTRDAHDRRPTPVSRAQQRAMAASARAVEAERDVVEERWDDLLAAEAADGAGGGVS